MTHESLDYVTRIRELGYRMTMQRQIVLDAVCEGGGHTSFEDISRRVQDKMPHINRSTIYRTLEFLQSVHLVVSATIGGKTVYEIAHHHPHHHLVCRKCGGEIEIGEEVLTPAFTRIAEETGFGVDVDHLVLEGLCRACRQQ